MVEFEIGDYVTPKREIGKIYEIEEIEEKFGIKYLVVRNIRDESDNLFLPAYEFFKVKITVEISL